jgi:hypothetical protein
MQTQTRIGGRIVQVAASSPFCSPRKKAHLPLSESLEPSPYPPSTVQPSTVQRLPRHGVDVQPPPRDDNFVLEENVEGSPIGIEVQVGFDVSSTSPSFDQETSCVTRLFTDQEDTRGGGSEEERPGDPPLPLEGPGGASGVRWGRRLEELMRCVDEGSAVMREFLG